MKSVFKALMVLDTFTMENPELTFTEVVSITGLGRTSSHELLKSLVSLNCLAQDY
ncbi:MAG: helix-turn-helix domain-containing protein [Nitrospinales bacterium]